MILWLNPSGHIVLTGQWPAICKYWKNVLQSMDIIKSLAEQSLAVCRDEITGSPTKPFICSWGMKCLILGLI